MKSTRLEDNDECDETQLWDSGSFFTQDEVASESDLRKGTLSESERSDILRRVHGRLLTESERDEILRRCVGQLSCRSVREIVKDVSDKRVLRVDEIRLLYFEKNWTMNGIAEEYGFKTAGPILQIFKEQGWKSRPAKALEVDPDAEQVRKLYFEQKQLLQEVGRRIEKTTYALKKLFRRIEWTFRNTEAQSVEEREARKRQAQRRHHEKVRRLRGEISSTECEICGIERWCIERMERFTLLTSSIP